jgi:hypothetical protein
MGFGTIGSGVAELLLKNQKSIVAKSGQASLEVKHILDIRDFSDRDDAHIFVKDFDTILKADFDGSLQAGNVSFVLASVSGALIRRREVGSFDWITLEYFPINTVEDFNIKFIDRTAAIGREYTYAFVPVLNGITGVYSSTNQLVECNRLVIVDADEIWSTTLADCFCDTTRMYPSSTIETLVSKYPTVVRNTLANYDTVAVSNSTWIPTDDENSCELIDVNDHSNDARITAWSKKFQDFLTNDKVKILKNVDGRIWMGFITTAPTDTADQVYNYRKVGFGLTETGEHDDVYDLYENGFVNAEPEWF